MSDFLDLGEPPAAPTAAARPGEYRVLARKYRPQTFDALIGQEAMVQTLSNAIRRDRIAHAFLMTGVRGVGKTSTARLIAKALNCETGPTITPCGVCDSCRAIAEGRHIDVIEMDAASHTGVDDVREIIDASRYAAVSARFKIYIVDEVHMLSKNAFNALLKTLEEPPAHVKFLFATTEVNKVPITVLSRCQRFDLKRIPGDRLAAHFADVAAQEGVAAEAEALQLIARAAEGSARDGLSILDQAIAHAGIEGTGVTAAAVREMLGLSDRGVVRDLLDRLLSGDGAGALAVLRHQYDHGVDPQAVLRALLETVHGTTLAKVGAPADPAQSVEERSARDGWAARLSFPALHRLWQLLLKGHDEVAGAVLPIEAAEMALLRVVHASSLPDPGDLARRLAGGQAPAPAPVIAAAPAPPPALQASAPTSLADLIALLEAKGEHRMAVGLAQRARVVRLVQSDLVLSGSSPWSADGLRDLADALRKATDQVWKVSLSDAPGDPTPAEADAAEEEAARRAILDEPIVRAAFDAFPDATLDQWPGQRRRA